MPVRLRVTPWALAELAVKEVMKDQNAPSHSRDYCTAGHAHSEILPVHPLVAASQGLGPSDSFVDEIPAFLWQDIRACYWNSLRQKATRPDLLESTMELWTATKAGKRLAARLDAFPGHDWFVRLDQMSSKNSPLGGNLPCKSLEDVLTKVSSSDRTIGCLNHEEQEAACEGRDMRIPLVFNNWDPGMDALREFRVFVPPPLARLPDRTLDSVTVHDFRISAISQYAWARRFEVPGLADDLEDTAARVRDAAQTLFGQLVRFVETEMEPEIRQMLLRYGFCFDVVVKEGWVVQIVEVNSFGAMSKCGACLFHWAKDGRMLDGLEGEDVRFPATV